MMLAIRPSSLILLFCAVLFVWPAAQAQAQPSDQPLQPRFGLGINTLISTEDGLGLGLRGRASAPINNDLSFAIDLGLTGFILQGRDDATYVFDPQVSAIITLPGGPRRAPYALAGVGAYLPFGENSDNSEGGPVLHGGVGWVQALSQTTIFYEFNPGLIIGEESVDLILPFRLGVIF